MLVLVESNSGKESAGKNIMMSQACNLFIETLLSGDADGVNEYIKRQEAREDMRERILKSCEKN